MPLKLVDYYLLNGIACNFLCLFKNLSRKIVKPKKTIVYRLGQIGDSVLILPAMDRLKKTTQTEISVACGEDNYRVFKNQKSIDKVFILKKGTRLDLQVLKEIKEEKFDLAIDTSQSASLSAILSYFTAKESIGFYNNKTRGRNRLYSQVKKINPGIHMVHNYLHLFGLKNEEIKLLPLYCEKLPKEIGTKLQKRFICIHASSPIKYKNWPIENFVKICKNLVDEGYCLVLVGAKSEQEDNQKILQEIGAKYLPKIVNLVGELNLNQLAELLKKSKGLFCNDGGVLHIGASMNIPVVGLFSIEDPKRYGPYNEKSASIWKEKKAQIRSYDYVWPNENKCKDIMKKIKVPEVGNILKRKFKNR